jgi:hypothetical protein
MVAIAISFALKKVSKIEVKRYEGLAQTDGQTGDMRIRTNEGTEHF